MTSLTVALLFPLASMSPPETEMTPPALLRGGGRNSTSPLRPPPPTRVKSVLAYGKQCKTLNQQARNLSHQVYQIIMYYTYFSAAVLTNKVIVTFFLSFYLCVLIGRCFAYICQQKGGGGAKSNNVKSIFFSWPPAFPNLGIIVYKLKKLPKQAAVYPNCPCKFLKVETDGYQNTSLKRRLCHQRRVKISSTCLMMLRPDMYRRFLMQRESKRERQRSSVALKSKGRPEFDSRLGTTGRSFPLSH
jgi:hypothetical protein